MQSHDQQSKSGEQRRPGVVLPGAEPLAPEAGRGGRPRVSLRPRASAARPDQEPGDLLQLQRIAGNRAVARLVGRRPVQRSIVNFRGTPQTANAALNYIKQHYQDAYNRMLRLRQNDQNLLLDLQTLVNDNTEYQYHEVPAKLEQHIKVAGFNADQTIPGPDPIDVKLWELKKEFPAGIDKTINLGGNCDVDTKIMKIEAELAIDGAPPALANWEAGFVQTVMSLDRTMTIGHTNGVVQQQRTTLPGPTRDGPAGYQGPWFDPSSFTGFATARVPTKVMMRDRPGVSWQLGNDASGANLVGNDTFKTWLVLRHKTDGRVIFLRMWTWAADYVNGISGGAEAVDDGSTAVLGGQVGKDSFVTTPWTKKRLPTLNDYSFMKKQATKRVTFRSGMMPKKTYGQLASQFNREIGSGKFQAAGVILQTIRNNLLLMDAKGLEYWQSLPLKQLHFQPLLDEVNAMIAYVQGLG